MNQNTLPPLSLARTLVFSMCIMLLQLAAIGFTVFLAAPATAVAMAKFLTIWSMFGIVLAPVIVVLSTWLRGTYAVENDNAHDKWLIKYSEILNSEAMSAMRIVSTGYWTAFACWMLWTLCMPVWASLMIVSLVIVAFSMKVGRVMAKQDAEKAYARIWRRVSLLPGKIRKEMIESLAD